MFAGFFRRLPLPRSLRWQFIIALSALALLIVASSLTAVYALRVSATSTRHLAGERLVRMQDAQDLVRHTLLIERETGRMLAADSLESMQGSYAVIVEQLNGLDRLVARLVAASDDVSVLTLHQSGQFFRNTSHVVAGLREGAWRAGAMDSAQQSQQQETLRQFRGELHRQAEAMVTSAQELSEHFTQDYREAVGQLAETSQDNQRWVLGLLAGSLILAWLVSRYFLGRQVLSRLQQVSHSLRRGDTADAPPLVPVHGSDEIGEMARAVEQFMGDRQRLATANQALQAERARQEELIGKLAEAQSQLLQSEKMASIGQLAAGVAHEINNPVGYVNSNMGALNKYIDELLKVLSAYEANEGELREETRAAMADLKSEVDLAYLREDVANLLAESMEGLQRVKRIVQDLKDFSHVDESERLWANLERGLDSTLNVAWNEIKYKAEVIKDYGGIPEIECNPYQLNQVFMNLLVNAAHAIESRGKITLRTGQDEQNVWVEVEDTGSGIRPEHLGRIFDPFFTTKPVGQGTGLGLSMSYGIVQQHGGRIEATSEPGIGSVFRVTLPLREAAH